MVKTEQVVQALQGVMDPELNRSLVELGMVRHVDVTDGLVTITLALSTMDCPLAYRIVSDARQAVLALDGVRQVDVMLDEMSAEEKQRLSGGKVEPGQVAHLNDIHHVVAV